MKDDKSKDETVVETTADVKGFTAEEARNYTKKKLAKQPKVAIRIPLPDGMSAEEAKGKAKPPNVICGINGLNYHIKRGVDVSVPTSVANVLRRANLI